MSNIESFANLLLKDYSSVHKNGPITKALEPIEGYFTTRVYRLHIYQNYSHAETYYIKESGDLDFQQFNDFVKQEYQNTRHIYQRFKSNTKLAVTCPITYSANHNAFAIKQIEGERVDRLLHEFLKSRVDGKKVEQLLDLVVDWLDRFQEIDFDTGNNLLNFRERESKKMEVLKSRIYRNVPKRDKHRFTNIFETMEEMISKLEVNHQSSVIKHNDFAPWNMIYDGTKLTVFDFADCSFDYPLYDKYFFIHSLQKIARKKPLSQSRIKAWQNYLKIKWGIGDDILNYYKSYFNLQDIEFLLRCIRGNSYIKYPAHRKVINYASFRRRISILRKALITKTADF